LIKKIPIGAGLGGGSSDAATCILGLNKMFELNIPEEKLLDLTSQLGADCAFFIKNKPVYAKGIGDDFSDLEINLNGLHFVVIYPNIHVSTPNAYKYIIPKQPQSDIRKIVREPVEYWKNNLKNDFEESVFNQYPTIKKIKDILYEAGAVYASMSGSGSTLFGIFKEEPSNKFNKYGQVWQFTL
jgi:4-diphosphocytidyl-2-C-methyl-D-erythritol kinase